jgi:hypothetical protein
MYEPNKFFLKREDGIGHGGVKIAAMAHLPQIFTEADALTLAADLVKLAGGPAAFEDYLLAAYHSREKLDEASRIGYEAKRHAREQAEAGKKAQADAMKAQADARAKAHADAEAGKKAQADAAGLAEAKRLASAGAPLIPGPYVK